MISGAMRPLSRRRQPLQRSTSPDFTRAIAPRGLPVIPATDRLYERLAPAAPEAVRSTLDAEQAAMWEAAGPEERRWLTLSFGVHHRVPEVLEPTGLSPAAPPEEIHAMARGAPAAGGAYYYADLVAEAAARAGLTIGEGIRGLDFGSSSGRVVRVLAAAWPEARWEGCDPNEDAVRWAGEHLPGIAFFPSPQAPQLPRPDGAYDLAFAISIWSHFAPDPARAWLAEMARLLVPGGVLVITTHGATSIAHEASIGRRPAHQLEEMVWTLHRRGHWYAPEFGEQGDWGVRDPGWGTAFMAPEWLLVEAGADWSVEVFRPGGSESNQDLWALRRR
jgi:SAM-dependent methyltransferase